MIFFNTERLYNRKNIFFKSAGDNINASGIGFKEVFIAGD
jgi:hypothetical protein